MLRDMKFFIYLMLTTVLGLNSFLSYAQNGIIEDKIWSGRQLDSTVSQNSGISYTWTPGIPTYQAYTFGNTEFIVNPNQRIFPTTNTTQSETSIDIHPQNSSIFFASANATSWPVTSIYGTGVYWTIDAGATTWIGSDIPPFGTNGGDPAAVIGVDGRFYVGYITNNSGQGISVSTNNGANWTTHQVAPNPGTLADKNHLYVDKSPASPFVNRVYSAWTDFGGANNYQVVIRYSTNFGQTWSGSINLSSSLSPGSHAQGVNINTGPNGEVYATFAIYDGWPGGEDAIGFAKSTDGGVTWTKNRIYSAVNFGIRGNLKPTQIRVNSFPSMTIDRSDGPNNGNIYITWPQRSVTPAGNDPDIVMIRSTNNGSTWSTPVRVNDDQINNGKDQYYPWCTVDQTSGALHIVFYDNRNTTNDSSGVWMATSFDGGLTFENYQVSDANFKPKPISGLASGYQGDYIGIVASDGKAYPLWAEDRTGNYQAWTTEVSFGTTKDVLVDQKLSTNASADSVGLWNVTLNKFDKYSVPKTFTWNVNDTKTLQGSQKIISNQKYNSWDGFSDVVNHQTFTILANIAELISQFNPTHSGVTIKNILEGTTLNGGEVQFKDPWLIDYEDPDFGNQPRNRGMKGTGPDALIFKGRPSPFNPDATTNYNGDVYQGVFLSQTPDPTNPDKPYYAVYSTLQDINLGGAIGTKAFYFQNWSAEPPGSASFQNPNSHQTAVVFNSGNAIVKANLKGTQLSDQQDAYNSNSQRKSIKTPNGTLVNTYVSMGKLWAERSVDGGNYWSLMNAGKPLDINEVESPSIDSRQSSLNYNDIAVVYHDTDTEQLKVSFLRTNDSHLPVTYDLGYFIGPNNFNLNPVVALTENKIFIVTNGSIWAGGQQPEGLVYFYGTLQSTTPISVSWLVAGEIIPGTTQHSQKPTIVADKNAGNVFHIAWQQGYAIKYCKLTESGGNISFSTVETPSSSSGFSENLFPSISLANGNPVLSWTGTGLPVGDSSEKISATEDKNPSRVVVRRKGTNWGDFQYAGSDVIYTNNNSVTTSQEKTVIVWNEGTSNQHKWMRRTGSVYSVPCNLSHSGHQAQVISGSDYQYMSSVVFNAAQLPYYFTRTTTNFTQECSGGGGELEKISSLSDSVVTFGRAGIVNINDVEFVFNTGDVIVDNTVVKFIDKPDTITYSSFQELNQYTRTENFQLNEGTLFYFSNIYYVVNKMIADSSLNENDNINFKVELVSAQSSQAIGVFDNINYNLSNLDKYENISYQVDCSGIQPGEYYLRLVTTVTGNAEYALANIMNQSGELDKKHYNTINYNGTELPETYSLEQNYPNPFNPNTTIRYQIPQDGMVTLKVYDILGSEVATLVNEQKTTGRYEVNFNATHLASGIYIYKISSGSFVSSKKMLLIK